MQKISASHSTFVKRVLPFATIAAASAWTYSAHRHEQYALELALLWFVVGSIALWLSMYVKLAAKRAAVVLSATTRATG